MPIKEQIEWDMMGFITYYCGCGAVEGTCDCFKEDGQLCEVTREVYSAFFCDTESDIIMEGANVAKDN